VVLRPDDPFAKKIPSVGIETRNVLVKVTLPKATGRKRKRGSQDPFRLLSNEAANATSVTSLDILRKMHDNQRKYTIEVIGVVNETHRFRALPDFQLRGSDQPIMDVLRNNILTPDYKKLREFKPDLSPRGGSIAFPGPPSFAHIDIPYRYEYQQAPGVVVIPGDDGKLIAKNVHGPARKVTWALPPDLDEVPQGPPHHIPLTSPDGLLLPRAVRQLQELLEKRPLITKRVALNTIPSISDSIFKEASQFVGYSFSAGPWRDTLIKYGVDPRKDPKYRTYQTLMFMIDKESMKTSGSVYGHWLRPERHQRDNPTSHIFDGKSITTNGKIWQICDVTDPLVQGIFQTDEIRVDCDIHRFGWFHNGTLAKARAIMKDKMRLLFAGEVPLEEDYLPILACPDELHHANIHKAVMTERQYGKRVARMSTDVRAIAQAQGSHLVDHPVTTALRPEEPLEPTEPSIEKDNANTALDESTSTTRQM
jgi:general transcription factor 3C polypeptide 5 (transcription factor C subunit 1)